VAWLKKSGAAVSSLVVKPSAGYLHNVKIYNNNAAIRYLHIFDATSVPSNGTAPAIPPYSLPATGAAVNPTEVTFGGSEYEGLRFDTGIVVANSTTQATLTLGSADSIIAAEYK
jgi:hypothetical protein